MNLFEIDFNKDKKFVGEDFRYRRKLLIILFVCVFVSALLLIRLFYSDTYSINLLISLFQEPYQFFKMISAGHNP